MYVHPPCIHVVRRRFVSKELLLNFLDAMSYVKMNVFHWHISDNCIFSIESKVYVLSCGVVVQLPAYTVYSTVVSFCVDATVCYNLCVYV